MRSLYSLFLIAALMVSGLAYAQPKNLVNLQPSAAQLTTDQTAPVQVILTVPPGFHVYRDMLQVDVVDPDGLTLGPPDFPPGLMKTDPANPANQREQYDLDVIVDVPATAKTAGTYNPTFSVRFQACKDTLCFMPKTQEITIPVTVSAGQRSGFRFDEKQDVLLVNSVGGTSAKHSRRPDVDFSSLPSSAAVRPEIGDTPHPVLARLIADKQTVAPGDTVRLGVHLEQAEGWHTYWRSPGEIGKPPEIAWGLPGDATASAHVFPIPHRYDEQDIVSYGYDHENMLFADVVIPDNLSTGEHTVQAKVKWLVCEKQCIPGNADLKLPLTVADATSESPFASLFDHYADKHPAPAGQIDGVKLEIGLDKPAVGSEMSFQATILVQPEDGRSVTLKQDAGTWPGFAPIIEGSFMVDDVHIQQVDDGSVVINIKATTYELWDGDPIPEADRIGGLLQLTVDGKDVATELVAAVPWVGADAVAVAVAAVDPVDEGSNPESSDAVVLTESPAQGGTGLLSALVMAFIGGSILNVMPCVLPVLTLKLYSLVGQQNISDSERRNAGLAYTAGILASFLVLALAILGVKAVSGGSVGWGFQFQYPGYVAGLATITFLFGLNLFGVFELPTPGANSVAQASAKEGLTGYFLTGVFATLLATPCSAPFLGTGMGFAFSLPSIWIVIFFLVAGLGLALPFLVIAFVPAMMRFLPRPGAWMDSFKQFLGFTLIATTVWLTDVLSAQIGSDGVTGFLIFLTVVSFAAWMYGRFGSAIHTMQRQLSVLGGAVGVIAVGGLAFVDLSPPQASECAPAIVDTTALDFSEEVPWQPFNPDAMAATEGKPVFIDFTADWCFSCKVNERTVLSTRTVREAMEDNGVVPLKADWTNNDPYISEWLSKYNRASIPFYLVIPADRSQDAIEFTEVITPEGIKSAMQKVKHSEG